MKSAKILVVEDEPFTAEHIRGTLQKKGYEVIALASSGKEAIEWMEKDKADIVLMDIHLNGKIEGINTAITIKKKYSTSIIYITQIEDEEIFRKAKETFPQNYIIKPFNDNTLLYAIELAIKNSENISKYEPVTTELKTGGVFIPTTGGINVKLLLENILYIKASGAYSEIYYETKEKRRDNYYKVSLSSNHVIEQLAYPALIKVHRSYHVNIHKIEKIQKSSIFVQDKEIPITEEYNNELKKILLFFKY